MIIAQSVVYNVTDEIIGVEGDVEHMRSQCFTTYTNEGVGYIGEWAKESGHEVYLSSIYE